jgi:hypothetical protein
MPIENICSKIFNVEITPPDSTNIERDFKIK